MCVSDRVVLGFFFVKAEKKSCPHGNNTIHVLLLLLFGSHVNLTKIYGGKSLFSFIVFATYLFWRGCAHTELTEPSVSTPHPLSQRHCWTRTALPPPPQPLALPLPPLPVYFSFSLVSCFLSVLWRKVAWRMPGLKQRRTLWSAWHCPLSLRAAKCCVYAGVLYNRDTLSPHLLLHQKYT